jgi:hypothetical protein
VSCGARACRIARARFGAGGRRDRGLRWTRPGRHPTFNTLRQPECSDAGSPALAACVESDAALIWECARGGVACLSSTLPRPPLQAWPARAVSPLAIIEHPQESAHPTGSWARGLRKNCLQPSSLLHQTAGSEPAKGLKPRSASHRPDPMLMSTSLYSTPTPPSSGAALAGAGDREAPRSRSRVRHSHSPFQRRGTGWSWRQRNNVVALNGKPRSSLGMG